MNSETYQPTTPDSINSENKQEGIKTQLANLVLENIKLRGFHTGNLTAAMAELYRDFSHDAPEIIGLSEPIPLQTEGARGFVDLHIGDVFETIALYYALSPFVESVAYTIGKVSKNKVPKTTIFRAKVLATTLTTSALELGLSHGDPADLFGVAIGATVLMLGYESFSTDGIINTNVKKWISQGIKLAKELDSLSGDFKDWPHTAA